MRDVSLFGVGGADGHAQAGSPPERCRGEESLTRCHDPCPGGGAEDTYVRTIDMSVFIDVGCIDGRRRRLTR